MGRYKSDDSDEDYNKKLKKKKKRRGRSRSRSGSGSEGSHVSSSKSKKFKRKHKRSRSRSRTPEKKRGLDARTSRRSRSNSLDKYISKKGRSRSTSLDKYISRKVRTPDRRSTRKSRSPSPRHSRRRSRTRSPVGRRKRSRSYSRGHRSKSPARRRSSSREKSRRSYSREKSTSRRSSADSRRTGRESPSRSNSSLGLNSLSVSQPQNVQAEERMRQALKAAAAADEKLREASGGLPGGSSFAESQAFANSVAAIESNSFVPSSFKSSRSYKVKEEAPESGSTHEDAIFGSLAVTGFSIKPDPDTKPIQMDPDSIIHPSLYCDPEEKMERWIQRLSQLRKKKLEGEAIA